LLDLSPLGGCHANAFLSRSLHIETTLLRAYAIVRRSHVMCSSLPATFGGQRGSSPPTYLEPARNIAGEGCIARNASEILFEILEAWGVGTVFGMAGDGINAPPLSGGEGRIR
jgi:hypothetical protein